MSFLIILFNRTIAYPIGSILTIISLWCYFFYLVPFTLTEQHLKEYFSAMVVIGVVLGAMIFFWHRSINKQFANRRRFIKEIPIRSAPLVFSSSRRTYIWIGRFAKITIDDVNDRVTVLDLVDGSTISGPKSNLVVSSGAASKVYGHSMSAEGSVVTSSGDRVSVTVNVPTPNSSKLSFSKTDNEVDLIFRPATGCVKSPKPAKQDRDVAESVRALTLTGYHQITDRLIDVLKKANCSVRV